MTTLATALTEIFTRRAYAPIVELQEERSLINSAKQGDNSATITLLYAYAPALRRAVAQFTSETADVEELQSTALLGFYSAVKAFDPEQHDRLASLIANHLTRTLREEYSTPTAFAVPARTLTRFYSILRKADGNPYEAAALAPTFDMTRETFLAVLSAVRSVGSYNALEDATRNGGGSDSTGTIDLDAQPLWDASTAEEDAELVAVAFDAVDDLESDVCRLAYGFTDYEPQSDAVIGERIGLSRQKAQRTRTGALNKMRAALAVI